MTWASQVPSSADLRACSASSSFTIWGKTTSPAMLKASTPNSTLSTRPMPAVSAPVVR